MKYRIYLKHLINGRSAFVQISASNGKRFTGLIEVYANNTGVRIENIYYYRETLDALPKINIYKFHENDLSKIEDAFINNFAY